MVKQLLSERLLRSEFTFGFELEAIVQSGSSLFDDTYEVFSNTDDYDDDDFKDELKTQIGEYLDNFLDGWKSHKHNKRIHGKSKTHGDSSIVIGEDDDDDDFTFEYSSPVLEATPDNFNRVITLLDSLKKKGIYTNESCGFHHHIKFGNMDYRDLIWVYVNLACDDEALAKLTSMDDYKFVNDEYASQEELDALAKAIFNRDWETAASYINDSKYRVFRLHPQGTIEWRGPRNFLNKGKLEEIKKFYKMFVFLIDSVIAYVDSNKIAGTNVSKEEFFKNIEEYLPVIKKSDTKKVQSVSIQKFMERLKRDIFMIPKIMKNNKLTTFFLKMFKDNPNYRLARDIIWEMHRNLNDGYCNETEYRERIKFLYSIFKQCFDADNLFDLFGIYDDLKYVLSQRDADELLNSIDDMMGYREKALALYKNGFEIKEPAKHFLRLIEISDNSLEYESLLTWMSYKDSDSRWGIMLGFLNEEEFGKLAVSIYDMILKDKIDVRKEHWIWTGLVENGNNISAKLSQNSTYKRPFVRLLNQLKFSEDKFSA